MPINFLPVLNHFEHVVFLGFFAGPRSSYSVILLALEQTLSATDSYSLVYPRGGINKLSNNENVRAMSYDR